MTDKRLALSLPRASAAALADRSTASGAGSPEPLGLFRPPLGVRPRPAVSVGDVLPQIVSAVIRGGARIPHSGLLHDAP